MSVPKDNPAKVKARFGNQIFKIKGLLTFGFKWDFIDIAFCQRVVEMGFEINTNKTNHDNTVL